MSKCCAPGEQSQNSSLLRPLLHIGIYLHLFDEDYPEFSFPISIAVVLWVMNACKRKALAISRVKDV